jgi:type II secretory pathway component GspD/PulD (secretin)
MGFTFGEFSNHTGTSIWLLRGWRQIWLATVFLTVAHGSPLAAQETPLVEPNTPTPAPTSPKTADTEGPLRFAFEGARWREVIKWLADESDLALHIGDLPTGSFTYTDPNSFTHQQAMDRVNLFLLPLGFTLVRSGNLLSVLDLGDPRSVRQLDALAKLVSIKQLEQLEDHDVVKCIFPLGKLKAEEAVEELSALNLMVAPAVFTRTNQLMITDTAGKLRNVKAILDAFEPATLDNGTIVQTFTLKHAHAEDILVVARPHLGLATGEMIGIDISLSADLLGKNIFATGIEDKVKLIEGLILAMDKPQESFSTNGKSELRSHHVEGGNVELVYNVLLTLLADKEIRLSMDETASSIVAMATPNIHAEIAETVAQLQAAEAEFEVIPLRNVDPHFAVSLLEEMLDLPDAFTDPDTIDADTPKIDADPGNMRLFVRAKRHQIEQIKKIVAGLDVSTGAGSGTKIRILPLKGRQAEQILETAAKFWREANPIILFRSTATSETQDTERVVNGESTGTRAATTAPLHADSPNTLDARFLTDNLNSQAPAIRCQVTPRGLLLQSDDTEALDKFEDHLRTIAGPVHSLPSPPIVFYLKYAKPDDAIRMLAELLDGGESAKEIGAGSLVNGYVTSAGSFLGSIVTSRGGTTTMMAGTITVVADSRLNRLIAQGTASDIERIENYLKIVDKDSSITSIETYGTSHVIELVHMKASEVAAVIRDAYANRISVAGGARQATSSRSQGQGKRESSATKTPSTTTSTNESQTEEPKKSPAKSSASQQVRNLEPKMTIAVHEASNSLIVIAPEPLFREIEQLAKLMDARSAQTIRIIPTTNVGAIELMLRQSLSGGTSTGSGRVESSTKPPSSRPPATRSNFPRSTYQAPNSSPLRVKRDQ